MEQQRMNSEHARAPGQGGTDGTKSTGNASERTTLADEFRMLLEAVISRAEDGISRAEPGNSRADEGMSQTRQDGARAEDDLDGCSAGDAGSCSWCPVCTAMSLVRGQYPELARLLLERFAEVVAMLRQAVADRWTDSPESAPQEERPVTKVQRIAVQRVDGRVREAGEC